MVINVKNYMLYFYNILNILIKTNHIKNNYFMKIENFNLFNLSGKFKNLYFSFII